MSIRINATIEEVNLVYTAEIYDEDTDKGVAKLQEFIAVVNK